jgi:hypothetical protein
MGGATTSHKISKNIGSWYKTTSKYINPIGRFYHEFQMICRILLVNTFLKGLFALKSVKSSLLCDTKQPACKTICINRFAPISHWQLWNFELLGWMVVVGTFSFVCIMLDDAEAKYEKINKIDDEEEKTAKFKQLKSTRKGRITYNYNQERLRAKAENRKNPAVEIFYITTILFRAILELWFLFVEYNLNLNQSQNANFLETMQLKEKYYCYTHFDDNPYDDKHSVDYFLPVANRSEIFYTDEVIETCQQQDRVTCWIKFSRVKSYGIQIMFLVLVCNFILSVLEFCWAVVDFVRDYFNHRQVKYE